LSHASLPGRRCRVGPPPPVPQSYASYRNSIENHLIPGFGKKKLQALRIDDVAGLIAKLEADGYSRASISAFLVPLNRICAKAVRRGFLPQNPVLGLDNDERPRSEEEVERRVLDSAEVPRLVAATPEPYRLLVEVSLATGLRQSEPLGLVWAEARLDAGKLDVRKQLDRKGRRVALKTKASWRTVPLGPSLVAGLRAHRQEALKLGQARPEDFVFRSATGGPMRHRTIVKRGLAPAIEAAGINDDPAKPKLTWHDLRRTAGSLLLRRGANIVYVSNFLGHADASITLRAYAKLLDAADQDDEATAIMEDALHGKDMENGGSERARTAGADDAANVRVLAKTTGGGD